MPLENPEERYNSFALTTLSPRKAKDGAGASAVNSKEPPEIPSRWPLLHIRREPARSQRALQ
jgi:hypothetical protein